MAGAEPITRRDGDRARLRTTDPLPAGSAQTRACGSPWRIAATVRVKDRGSRCLRPARLVRESPPCPCHRPAGCFYARQSVTAPSRRSRWPPTVLSALAQAGPFWSVTAAARASVPPIAVLHSSVLPPHSLSDRSNLHYVRGLTGMAGFVSLRASRPLLVGDRRTPARLGHGAEGHGAAVSAPRPVAPASVDRSAAVSAAFPGRDEEHRQGGMSWRW